MHSILMRDKQGRPSVPSFNVIDHSLDPLDFFFWKKGYENKDASKE